MEKLILAASFLVLSVPANAAMVTYQLHDVIFSDGATANGSFDCSMENGCIATNISVTTTASQQRNYNVTYTAPATNSVLGTNQGLSLSSTVGSDTSYWDISFEGVGPFAGAFYLTSPANEAYPVYTWYTEHDSQNSYTRYVISGYVAPVPLPATSWLFSMSLTGLFFGERYFSTQSLTNSKRRIRSSPGPGNQKTSLAHGFSRNLNEVEASSGLRALININALFGFVQ